jgi:hypothetical protein
MSNFAEHAARAIAAPMVEPDEGQTKQLWILLHGFYGNLLLSKFSTGEVDGHGKDKGVRSAMKVWASGLQKYSFDVLASAVEKCKEKHKEYPPSLPQFIDLCEACMPRTTYFERGGVPKVALSSDYLSVRSRVAREAAIYKVKMTLAKPVEPGGVDVLRGLVAQAVALAGGDEVAALRRAAA